VTPEAWIAGLVGIAAIVEDLARRRISNWIPVAAFAAGLCLQILRGGWTGAGVALLGTLSGAGVFLIFYLLGGMGGGDVKLMAGFGAVLGSHRLFEAALWTAGCGGVMAAPVPLRSSFLARQVRGSRAGRGSSGLTTRGNNSIRSSHCGGRVAEPGPEVMREELFGARTRVKRGGRKNYGS
jgi:Flp pilus assembly protein protease CpaA